MKYHKEDLVLFIKKALLRKIAQPQQELNFNTEETRDTIKDKILDMIDKLPVPKDDMFKVEIANDVSRSGSEFNLKISIKPLWPLELEEKPADESK